MGDREVVRTVGQHMLEGGRVGSRKGELVVPQELMKLGSDGEYYDEITGLWLDPSLVDVARKEEMEEVNKTRSL